MVQHNREAICASSGMEQDKPQTCAVGKVCTSPLGCSSSGPPFLCEHELGLNMGPRLSYYHALHPWPSCPDPPVKHTLSSLELQRGLGGG